MDLIVDGLLGFFAPYLTDDSRASGGAKSKNDARALVHISPESLAGRDVSDWASRIVEQCMMSMTSNLDAGKPVFAHSRAADTR